MTISYGEKAAAQAARLTANTAVSDAQTAYGLKKETLYDLAADAQTAAEVTTAAKALLGSSLEVTSLDGNDGDPATYTFTGGAVGDAVVGVLHLSTKADVATIAVEDPADYAITADTLTGPGTDFTNDQLIVIWADLT